MWHADTGLCCIHGPQVNLCTGLVGLAVDMNTTCTAGAGTLTLELGILSRLLGDPTYENMARKSVRTLWDLRHPHTGLVGEENTSGGWLCVRGAWVASDKVTL